MDTRTALGMTFGCLFWAKRSSKMFEGEIGK